MLPFLAMPPGTRPTGGRCVTDIRQQGVPAVPAAGRRFHAYTAKHLDALAARAGLDASERLAVRAVATVLPFRTNDYVVENLIDWDAAPDDPIYRLVFPQSDMLPAADVQRMARLLARDAPAGEVTAAAHEVRTRLNPHPAGQLALNIPDLGDEPLPGVQHKYPETVLVFPKQAQTCHAYCTYCFRWAQFVDEPDLKIATADTDRVIEYLRRHREVSSVLITGGDPMIMGAEVLRRYVEPLFDQGLEHIESVRIGSKSLAYWPQRFVTDPDADDTLRLFEEIVASGRSLAFMAHFSHPRELESPLVAEAVRRIRDTGAVIRTPAPLACGYGIFREAYQSVSGLGRTVRGPSMSATPGKLCVDGITEVAGEKVFVLHMIQARDPDLVGKPFFARYNPDATWLSDLEPAFAARFPFEPDPEELPGLWAPSVFQPAS